MALGGNTSKKITPQDSCKMGIMISREEMREVGSERIGCPSVEFQRHSCLRKGFSADLCGQNPQIPRDRFKPCPAPEAQQPWGTTGTGPSLLVCSLAVPFLCGDQLQEDAVGPQERLYHPLPLLCALGDPDVLSPRQRQRLQLLLHGPETG